MKRRPTAAEREMWHAWVRLSGLSPRDAMQALMADVPDRSIDAVCRELRACLERR